MRLVYLTTFTYPSSFANRLQVAKMAEAFSRACDFKLFVGHMNISREELIKTNSIRYPFTVESLRVRAGRFRLLRMVLQARPVIKQEQANTVFYVREPLFAFFLTLLSKRFRSSFYLEAHSFVRYPRFVYGRVFLLARGIIATSEKKAVIFREKFNVPAKKVLVRGNGFDADMVCAMPEREEARRILGIPTGKRVVVMVGKPTDERGIDAFLEAASLLPDVVFISVGGLPQEIQRIREYRGFSSVKFVERVAPAEVASYYAAADSIAVLLSTKFPEIAKFASPLKAREALATGVPVVFSDVPALHDIAGEDLVTFVKPNDAQALADGIKIIFDTGESSAKKAKKAKELFLKQSWYNRAEDIVKFMESGYAHSQ
ncbi:MAG: glycosyltransferase family 4 protein [Patescibacteria group bacterium]